MIARVHAIKYLTLIPAKILRLDNIIGSITSGKDADFCVFKLKTYRKMQIKNTAIHFLIS